MESEINGQGPGITNEDLEELYKKLDLLDEDDILVFSWQHS